MFGGPRQKQAAPPESRYCPPINTSCTGFLPRQQGISTMLPTFSTSISARLPGARLSQSCY